MVLEIYNFSLLITFQIEDGHCSAILRTWSAYEAAELLSKELESNMSTTNR